ncbi:MAG: hypothetical protein KatS3mg132_230 [Limisphaera sp.]|nr:MAG: hypothetical protein KatS3mg132_230 [Limisphaera sp.]
MRVFGQVRQGRLELLGCAHQVEVDGRHRQRARQRQVFLEAAEVGGQHQRRVFGPAQRRIGLLVGLASAGRQVAHQTGLVHLHVAGAGRLQSAQHLGIDGQQTIE